MKKILCLLIMSVMVSLVGAVGITGVDFNAPDTDEIISDTFNISWNNSEGNPNMFLQYREGGCYTGSWSTLTGPFLETVKNYLWDTSARTDGQYCLRIEYSGSEETSGNFTIDNTAPNITFDNTPYSAIVNQSIFINVTLVDENVVKNYTIDFGDTSAVVEANVGSVIGLVNQSNTYNASGTYTVTITARDNAGNSVISTKIVTVNAAAPDWVIELSATGMNMFSIPLIPKSTDIEDVLDESVSDNAEKIWSYQKGEWKYNTPTSSGWSTSSSRLQEIVPGYGYIIFMDDDAVVYGSGKELGQDVPPEVTLTTGWNLVGHYGLETDVTSTQAFSSLELGTDKYQHILLEADGSGNFQIVGHSLQPTEAYWLSIKSINLEKDELRYFTYFPCTEAY